VGLEMPAQLPRDRRRCPPDSAGDLADTVPVLAQGRDALAFQQRQVARRACLLSHPRRWQTTRLGAPPIPGLAADPDLPAGLDGGHPTQDQLPVLVLQHQAPLAASSRHLHTPSFSRSVATSLRTRPSTRGPDSPAVDNGSVAAIRITNGCVGPMVDRANGEERIRQMVGRMTAAGAMEAHRATGDQRSQVVTALCRAFFDDRIYRWSVPDGAQRRRSAALFYSRFVDACWPHG